MEKLRQIRQTLREIDDRVHDAFRVGLVGLGNRVSPAPAPGEDDDVADFAAYLLQPAPALRIDWGSCYVPRHDHDAHFGDADAGVLGVADGVGQYMEDGVDAGAFSRGLIRNASAEVAGTEPGAAPDCPYVVLRRAYEKTAALRAPGASTAVILLLAGNALRWAYIGDSAFAVLRDGRVVFLSEPQQHLSRRSGQKLIHYSRHQNKLHGCPAARWKLVFSFDDPPFQLSAKGGDCVTEARTYADASHSAVAVRAGDVVVVGTDGLFHNMSQEQLEGTVRMGSRLGFSPKNMVDVIAGVAYERSKQPLSRRRCMGKPDDITVLVAFVVQSDS